MSSSPPKRLSVATRRSTPHLKAFVDHCQFGFLWKSYFVATLIVGAVGAVGALVTAGLVAAGLMGPGVLLWIFTNVFGLALFGGLGVGAWLRAKRPPEAAEALTQEAKPIAAQLRASLAQNRLHRELHPAAIDLVEEAARCWKRVHDATEGTYWKSDALPAHYRSVREQAKQNADQAMMEILLHLRSAMKPVGQPKTLVEGLQTMLDAIGVSIATLKPEEPLPEGFASAAVVAKGLSDLATEIEQTSIRAVTSSSAELDSGQSIRKTLDELRQIREAETELEQELRT